MYITKSRKKLAYTSIMVLLTSVYSSSSFGMEKAGKDIPGYHHVAQQLKLAFKETNGTLPSNIVRMQRTPSCSSIVKKEVGARKLSENRPVERQNNMVRPTIMNKEKNRVNLFEVRHSALRQGLCKALNQEKYLDVFSATTGNIYFLVEHLKNSRDQDFFPKELSQWMNDFAGESNRDYTHFYTLPKNTRAPIYLMQSFFEEQGVQLNRYTSNPDTFLAAEQYGVRLRIDPHTGERCALVMTQEERENFQNYVEVQSIIQDFYNKYVDLYSDQLRFEVREPTLMGLQKKSVALVVSPLTGPEKGERMKEAHEAIEEFDRMMQRQMQRQMQQRWLIKNFK